MEFNKISAPSLKELFVRELETMILSGKLAVGEKLPPERELALSMQVSRAVINSGVLELTNKGFLLVKPRIGTFVADYRRNGTLETLISIVKYNGNLLRKDEVRSILELRVALDTLAVENCISRITPQELDILRELTQKIQTASTAQEAASFAFLFQHELAVLSGNTLIPLIFMSFKELVLVLWSRFCQLYGIEALYQNTSALFFHIEQRDVEAAREYISGSIYESIYGDRQIYYGRGEPMCSSE